MQKTVENIQAIINQVLVTEGVTLPEGTVSRIAQTYLDDPDQLIEELGKFTDQDDEETVNIPMEVRETLDMLFSDFKPTEKYEHERNAPVIPVKIGDKTFDTFIDQRGVQRFKQNLVITYLVDNATRPTDLNTLAIKHAEGQFPADHWLDFYTSFGYSVSGLLSLSYFSAYPVENPLWDEN